MASKKRTFGMIKQRKGRPGFYCVWRHRGLRYRRSAGKTLRAAERALAQVQSLLADGRSIEYVLSKVFGEATAETLTFKRAAALYLKDSEGRNRQSTYERDIKRLKIVCKAPWALKPIGEIKTDQIARWIADRRRGGNAPSTCNRYLAAIGAVFRWAMGLGYVPESPMKNVRRYSEKGRERTFFLAPAQAVALVAMAEEPVFQAVLDSGIKTGARKRELLDLTWENVDLDRAEIRIISSSAKTSISRVIPIPGSLVTRLRELRGSQKVSRLDGSDPVFAYPDGSRLTEGRLRGALDRLKRRLKRTKKEAAPFPQEKVDRLVFYTLRHSYASIALQNGASIFEVSKIMGHSAVTITVARYGHFAPEAARASVARLDEALAAAEASIKSSAEGA